MDLSNELDKTNDVTLLTLKDDKLNPQQSQFYEFDLLDKVKYENLGLPPKVFSGAKDSEICIDDYSSKRVNAEVGMNMLDNRIGAGVSAHVIKIREL